MFRLAFYKVPIMLTCVFFVFFNTTDQTWAFVVDIDHISKLEKSFRHILAAWW